MNEQPAVKRGPGRPRKNLESKRPEAVTPKHKMRAAPNWETFEPGSDDTPDRLKIDPSLVPDGMALQWVTDSVLGQGVPQHRADFERKGWTPVHQDDFEGQFNGMFMARNAPGEINLDGLVLMARPIEYTLKAKQFERRKALEQVAIKEQALRGGDLPVTLDPRHPSALGTNRISKTMERISIPED